MYCLFYLLPANSFISIHKGIFMTAIKLKKKKKNKKIKD